MVRRRTTKTEKSFAETDHAPVTTPVGLDGGSVVCIAESAVADSAEPPAQEGDDNSSEAAQTVRDEQKDIDDLINLYKTFIGELEKARSGRSNDIDDAAFLIAGLSETHQKHWLSRLRLRAHLRRAEWEGLIEEDELEVLTSRGLRYIDAYIQFSWENFQGDQFSWENFLDNENWLFFFRQDLDSFMDTLKMPEHEFKKNRPFHYRTKLIKALKSYSLFDKLQTCGDKRFVANHPNDWLFDPRTQDIDELGF
ncbi:MAG: hypothetical protein K8F91_19560 [Candidatus Obscuribacterales bacterium]|nr:hypothetical protein [Candidatus Obscuribacterales bacterium]